MSDHNIKASNTVFLASYAALLGALSMGLSLGYSAPVLEQMSSDLCPNYNCTNFVGKNSSILDTNESVRETQKSLIGAFLPLGALIGGMVGEPSNRMLGRRLSLIVCGIPFAIGWLFIALASNVGLIYAGRLLTGFTCGLASQTAPTYVVEISPPSIRGTLGTCFQVMVTLGILLVPIFISFCSWSTTAVICSLFAISMSVLMYFVPETPQWLISKNMIPEAESSLKQLRQSPITEELNNMTQAFNNAQQLKGEGIAATIGSITFYKPLILALSLMFFQQFSGVNAILFYQTEIFKKAASNLSPLVATISVCVAQVIATISGSALVDYLGRRILLIASGLGHCVSLLIFGIYQYRDDQFKENNAWIAVASIVVFIISFSIGYGPIPWMMIPELTSNRVRSLVASISTAFNWTCAFVITLAVRPLITAIGGSLTYWIFSLICFASCFFVFFALPETKGKSEQQIQTELFGLPQLTGAQELSSPKRSSERQNS